MALAQIIEAYPGILPLVHDGDAELLDRWWSDQTARKLGEWVMQCTRIGQLPDGTQFRVLVDQPTDGDPSQVMVAATEYAGGLFAPDGRTPHMSVAMARVLRDTMAPNATLVVLPNDGYRQSNLGLTPRERDTLAGHNMTPLVDRIKTVVGPNADKVITYGASQGAVTTMAYAAAVNDVPDIVLAGAFAAPTVRARSLVRLARDFLGSAPQTSMVRNIRLTNPNGEINRNALPYSEAYAQAFTLGNTWRYMLACARPGNTVAAGTMAEATFVGDATKILRKGGSFVHMWGERDSVSPADANLMAECAIREAMANDGMTEGYHPYEFTGPDVDHSIITVPLALFAMRHALETRTGQA